ncbi:MAG: PEGA domain-containing protein [Candidatus Acidiferrales bacterium]
MVKGQATGQYSGGSSVAAGNTGQPKAPRWTPATPAKEHSTPTHLPASASPAPEIANRQAIEQRAGKDAAKLLLRSVPSGARVWIDGAFVGNTPTLLVVAPGKYLLEMRGERFDSAARVIDVLPSEMRDVALQLAVRYPTHVSTR